MNCGILQNKVKSAILFMVSSAWDWFHAGATHFVLQDSETPLYSRLGPKNLKRLFYCFLPLFSSLIILKKINRIALPKKKMALLSEANLRRMNLDRESREPRSAFKSQSINGNEITGRTLSFTESNPHLPRAVCVSDSSDKSDSFLSLFIIAPLKEFLLGFTCLPSQGVGCV